MALDISSQANAVGDMMKDGYELSTSVSEATNIKDMTSRALDAQMKMAMAKTANDMLSKSINNAKECMKSCTQSM
jgi:hypothetical protein